MSALAKNTKMTVIPCLRYRSALAAIDWLWQTFGFEEQLVVSSEDGRGFLSGQAGQIRQRGLSIGSRARIRIRGIGTLQMGLKGYEVYIAQGKYRLIPHVW